MALGHMSAGIVHDFNNLLTVIYGHAELAIHAADRDPAQIRRSLEQIHEVSLKGSQMTRQLLNYMRSETADFKKVDLNKMVADILPLLEKLTGSSIVFRFQPNISPAPVLACSVQLEQVFMNLVVNARDAMPVGGMLSLQIEKTPVLPSNLSLKPDIITPPFIHVSLTDTGSGMTPEVRDKIFQPFFTTKKKGLGTGLGMAIISQILNQHQAALAIESEPGHGTTIHIYFTEYSDASATGAARRSPHERPSILVVDDDELILNITRQILEGAGYTVLSALQGREAIDLYRKHREEIAVVLLDLHMYPLNGLDVCKEIKEISPDQSVVFCTGSGDKVEQIPLHQWTHTSLLLKPYSIIELISVVDKLTAHTRTAPTH